MAISLVALCRAVQLPEPVPEFRFHPVRRWRFDWGWPDQKVALEIQGAIFTQGRHTRGPALLKEFEKLNAAACAGWRVLFATPRQVQDGSVIALLEAALRTA